MSTGGNAPISASVQEIWRRQIPETCRRLELLQQAAFKIRQGSLLTEGERAEAVAVAHKMAGGLGMFGLAEAGLKAREIEAVLTGETSRDALPALVADLCEHLRPALS